MCIEYSGSQIQQDDLRPIHGPFYSATIILKDLDAQQHWQTKRPERGGP